MKKTLKYLFIFFALYLVIGTIFTIIRNKSENVGDIDLNLPLGTSDVALVKKYTASCVETSKSKNQFPKKIVGISSVYPIDEKYYQLSRELGATWMRAEFNWRNIEKPDGTYDWSSADKMVEEMNTNNFQVLGNINYIPTNLHTWEDIREHFQKFTRALAERYDSKGIHYYEIFNEPNLSGWGWLDKKTKPEEYVGEYLILLSIANKEILSVNKNNVIVIGGISSDDVTGMPYPDFIDKLNSFDSMNCFDIFAFHPYGHEGKFGRTVAELNSILNKYSVHNKPIWFNEYGTDQNKKLEYSVQSMFKERDVVDAWFWFTLRDLRPNNRWTYGLTDYNFKPKEPYYTFQNLLTK